MSLRKLFLTVFTVCLCLTLPIAAACFGNEEKELPAIPVASIGLDKTSLGLEVGESYTLTATVLPSNATDREVSWSSSAPAVATVSGGKVDAVSAGTAEITATASGKTAVCTVTVTQKEVVTVPVASVTLNRDALSLTVGGKSTLVPTVLPANATNRAVSWRSSNSSVATVDGGEVTAVAAGTAKITATADGKSAICNVTVTGNEFVEVTSVTLNRTELELKRGDSITLTATVSPDNATENEVLWSSSDASVAAVENGLVSAKAVGTARITASCGKVKAVCEIAVIAEPEIPDSNVITYAHAGLESAAFEWKEANPAGAKAEYKLSSASSYTRVDGQLIRAISDGAARVDILGLKGGEKYDFKITSSDGKTAYAKGVEIAAHDRAGYAHYGFSGVGAYNDDGTLKAGAKVVYVTEANKNDVDGKGNSIAEYLASIQNNNSPVVIRIIGTVGSATWNEIEYGFPDGLTEDKVVGINGKKLPTDNKLLIQSELIKGGYNTLNEYPDKLGGARCVAIDGLVSKASYSSGEYDSLWNDCQIKNVSNLTIEGVGEDAEIFQWGFTFKSCNSVEVRNLRFYDYTEDACSIEGSENSTTLAGFKHKNFWVHHNTFDLGVNYWDVCAEQDKHDGDGATDFKYISNITVAYNRYNGTHKTGLVGGSDTAHQACFTFHHNYYNGCDQRMPLGRQANMHLYNNYYKSSGLYSVSLRAGAYAFIENSVFTSGKAKTKPVELVKGSNGAPSAKIIGCEIEGEIANGVGSGYLYVGDDRTVTVQGDNLYGLNFEQSANFYTVDNMLSASEVKTVIPEVAGVMKRNSNIKIEGGSEEEEPPVIVPPEPSDGQSVSFTSADEGKAVAVDGVFADGDAFTASWNKTKSAVTKGFSAAVADDGSEKSFGYALLSNGTGGGVTVTAKSAITLTVYYGASDSQFSVKDQSKSGNLSWTVDGVKQTSAKTESKSNKTAYSEVITLEAGQTVIFEISANRFVLYGLYAE